MLQRAIAQFRSDQSGATAIEYGLIAALVAVAILGSLALMGTSVEGLYSGQMGSAATTFATATDSMQ